MKNFFLMFLTAALLLSGMTFAIGKMSVCAAAQDRLATIPPEQEQLLGSAHYLSAFYTDVTYDRSYQQLRIRE